MHMQSVSITNQTRDTLVCREAGVADTFATRLFGLLGRDTLEPGTGLLLQPSTGAHTWGMKFDIDIVTLDEENRVVGLWENVRPWKMRGLSARTRSVLELPAGQIAKANIAVGDELSVTDARLPHHVTCGPLVPFLRLHAAV
jgi:uncharacterized membrane protein (UPF0127 family)